MSVAVDRSQEGLLVLLVRGLHLARLLGGVLIGLWLTGLMTSPRSTALRQRNGPALPPSRPF